MEEPIDYYFGNPRRDVAALIPPGVRTVLEIGCGRGMFRTNFTDVDEYVGVEPAQEPAAEAAGRLDRVVVATFEEAAERLPLAYFDLVVCNDVIEHMPDHDRFLRAIRRHLKPGGALLGSVPNIRFFRTMFDLLVRKQWRYQDSGVLDRTHLRFFTEHSWRDTLLAHGYRVDAMRGLLDGQTESRRQRVVNGMWVRLIGSDSRYQQFAFLARVPPSATEVDGARGAS